MSRSVVVEKVYAHPREKVWRALTTPEILAAWLMPNDFRPEVGHRFTFRTDPGPGFDGIVHCEVLTLAAPETLAFTWKGGPLDTVVTFTLTEVAGGTRLRMEHTGFRGFKAGLVRLILAAGCRTIYGTRLPAALDSMDAEERAEHPPPNACMTPGQKVVAGVLSLFSRRKDGRTS